MNIIKNKSTTIEKHRTIPLIILGYLLAGLILIFISSISANAGTIYGTITDIDSSPIENAIVKVVSQSNDFISVIETDASGYYSVNDLPIDVYYVLVSHSLYLEASSLFISVTALSLYDYSTTLDPLPPVLPIIGSVINVHRPDDTMWTYLEVVIENDFLGQLPTDIDAITVDGPQGILAQHPTDDWEYYPELRDFFIAIPGSPVDFAEYRFDVTSGSLSETATDVQDTNWTIDIPDTTTFSPVNGTTLSSKIPSFTWGPVTPPEGSGITVHYRLEICEAIYMPPGDDWTGGWVVGQRVYATNRVAGMLSLTVPNGILEPGYTYFWRVRVVDASLWEDVQNRSHSNFLAFTVEKDPKRLQWFDVTVYNGDLSIDFGILPGFRDKLVSAFLNIPNDSIIDNEDPANAWDLNDNQFVDWDTECRYLDIQVKNFGSAVPANYGTYTLTLNFSDGAKEVYTYSFQVAVVPAVTNINHTVNSDGSINVTWDRPLTGDYYYQVRIRNLDGSKEYCRAGSFFNASAATLSAWDLRCLKKGETYRLLVRVYDLNFNAAETIRADDVSYDPISLTHTGYDSIGVWSWKGGLALHVDTRPGSREELLSSDVFGPALPIGYGFDLTNDWYSISTETQSNDGWWHEESGTLPDPGNYTFTMTFDLNEDSVVDRTEVFIKSLNDVSVIPASDLSADITESGAINFSWGANYDQEYQVRLRSLDGSKEYYSSSTQLIPNPGGIPSSPGFTATASFWDLRGLEHGQEYQWFVRAYDPDFNVMEQSLNLTFVYNPFDNEGDGLFNLWDTDDDNDGLTDIDEVNIYGTDPLIQNLDDDDDGLPNEYENNIGTDPQSQDGDGDGLWDIEEIAAGTDPSLEDTDEDGYLDGEDAFPLDGSEWADDDGDDYGNNSDNCPKDYNPQQPDFDLDGIGDTCDQDADGDGYLSPYFSGNDCDDLDPLIYPGDGTCEGISAKPPDKNLLEPPADSDNDTVADTGDNCPGIANEDQADSDGDGIGDVCDNCDIIVNPDQDLPVFYRDQDDDGYSTGETLEVCSLEPPAGYKRFDELSGPDIDCADNNENINPGITEIPNNGINDDCDPNTPDKIEAYNIGFDMAGRAYDTWIPEDGIPVDISFKVTGPSGDVTVTDWTFTMVSVSSIPGKYTNDASDDISEDFDWPVNSNTINLTPNDYGGTIVIHAIATFTVDGAPTELEKDFSFPKDTDKDGMADPWEMDNGLDRLTPDSGLDPDNDGLTNLEEYRGIKWGELVLSTDNSKYATSAFVPVGTPSLIRTDPNRRSLFIQYQSFDEDYPFALGEAFKNAGIDVYALSTDNVTNNGLLSNDNNIDAVTIRLIDDAYGNESGHIKKRGTRDYTFSTLGISSFGTIDSYGVSCVIFKPAINYYFDDKPYKDGTTLTNGNIKKPEWGPINNMLDPVSEVEDKDDDGNIDSREDLTNNGFDGDHLVRATSGDDLWDFNNDLSTFDVDNNSLVELPVGDTAKEYTRAQVLKHVVTHEIGHNVGINLHTEEPSCVMYKYSTDWLRDGNFSETAKNLIKIINN